MPAKLAPVAIQPWRLDPDGTVTVQRGAQFWSARSGRRVACHLCYRACELADGEDGWCRFRGNRGGRMELHAHGQITSQVRQRRGYQVDPFLTYKPGALSLFVGGTHCTAGCTFCMSKEITWRPETVPWLEDRPGRLATTGGHYNYRALAHPEGIVAVAQEWGCQHILFGINEPTLTWEYTYDVARLARAAGLDVLIETNGFSGAAPVRKLAPYVNVAYLGIKGSLDPGFYDRWMKSPGATPHVLEAGRAWHAAGVRVVVGEVVAPPHMQDDDTFETAATRLYTWVHDTLGPHTPMNVGGMFLPGPRIEDGRPAAPFLPARATGADREHYARRQMDALAIAQSAGLHYAYRKTDDSTFTCHDCGGVLLQFRSPLQCCTPCIMPTNYCRWWQHDQHVTNGRCDHCGTPVPIVTLPPAELARANRIADHMTRQATQHTIRLTPGRGFAPAIPSTIGGPADAS